MEQLDAQDLTLFLAYQHVKSLGMKNLKTQIFNLGVKAGLDLESVDCQTSVQDVVKKNKSFERKLEIQEIDKHTHQLVYDYLSRAGYTDVAEEFAKIYRIEKRVKPLENLETVIQCEKNEMSQYSKSGKVRTCKRKGLVAFERMDKQNN